MQSEYLYDENGKQKQGITYGWNVETQSFFPLSKIIRTFINYSQNQVLWDSSDVYFWYQELGIYKPGLRVQMSTTLDSQTELHRTGILYKYDIDFNNWNEVDNFFSKYTKESSLSTNSVEPNSFSIYPNPTNGFLNINSSELLTNPLFELYDVKGRKILSNPFKLAEPIDVSGLEPSLYIYNVKDGDKVIQSGKVIKK